MLIETDTLNDGFSGKDVFRKYSMYGKFLAAISPDDWQKEQVGFLDTFLNLSSNLFQAQLSKKVTKTTAPNIMVKNRTYKILGFDEVTFRQF